LPRTYAELLIDAEETPFDLLHRKTQFFGDLAIRHPVGGTTQDFALSVGQSDLLPTGPLSLSLSSPALYPVLYPGQRAELGRLNHLNP
jgi:hypothetical protein